MKRFSVFALAAFVGWCSALVVLAAQGTPDAAPAGDQQARGKALYVDKRRRQIGRKLLGQSGS